MKGGIFICGVAKMSKAMKHLVGINDEYYRQKKGLVDRGVPPEEITRLEARILEMHRTTTCSFEDAARSVFGEARSMFNGEPLEPITVRIEEPPGGKE